MLTHGNDRYIYIYIYIYTYIYIYMYIYIIYIYVCIYIYIYIYLFSYSGVEINKNYIFHNFKFYVCLWSSGDRYSPDDRKHTWNLKFWIMVFIYSYSWINILLCLIIEHSRYMTFCSLIYIIYILLAILIISHDLFLECSFSFFHFFHCINFWYNII